MHLMIFDPHEQGHYLTFVRYLLDGSRDADRVTVVLHRRVKDSAPYALQLRDRVANATVDTSIQPDSYRNAPQLFDDFKSADERHRPDHVWIPSADLLVGAANLSHALRKWQLRANTEAECGLIELRFHYPPKRWRGYVRQVLDRTLLSLGPWQSMHTIDPTFFNWVQQRGERLRRRFTLVPDPLDEFAPITKSEARRFLGIPLEGRYIGSMGNLAIPRKGTHLLLEGFSRAKLGITDRLLLAGTLGEPLRQTLRNDYRQACEQGRIVVLDRYVNEVELMNAFAAVDLVCAPYADHFGSSGVALRTAQAGRPILAPCQGWFAEMVPRFGLGATGNILDPTGLATGIESALERSHAFVVTAACARLLEYSRASNFAGLWAARMRARMGLPPDASLRTWNWAQQG